MSLIRYIVYICLLPFSWSTKTKRRAIYVDALNFFLEEILKENVSFKGNRGWGLCYYISYFTRGLRTRRSLITNTAEFPLWKFPELYCQRPWKTSGGLYWWPRNTEGTQKRLIALTRAIILSI